LEKALELYQAEIEQARRRRCRRGWKPIRCSLAAAVRAGLERRRSSAGARRLPARLEMLFRSAADLLHRRDLMQCEDSLRSDPRCGCSHLDAEAARRSLLKSDADFDRAVAERGVEAWSRRSPRTARCCGGAPILRGHEKIRAAMAELGDPRKARPS